MKKYLILFGFLVFSFSFADVPVEINYTGFLREFGQPVSGQRNVELKIYTQETGGIPIWSSGVMNINVSSGIFNCVISPNIDFRDGNFWIETTVNSKIFSPRQKITPQMLAIHSKTAEGLSKKGDLYFVVNTATVAVVSQECITINSNLSLSGIIISSNAVYTHAIADNAITTAKIQDNAITTAKIQDNAVTNNKIASIDAGKITSGVLSISRGGTGNSSFNANEIVVVNSNATALQSSGKTLPAGAVVGTTDIQTLTNKTFSTGCIWQGNTLQVSYGGTGATNLTGILKGNGTNPVTGITGTTGYLAKWTATDNIGNSIIYDDGSKVGIGTTALGVARVNIQGATSDYTAYGLYVKNSNNTAILTVRNDVRVGIGKDNPAGTLDVQGKIKEYGYDLLPRGVIVMWSGSITSIPPGWALCDGRTYTAPDGTLVTTPDLRNRFIVGAGDEYSVGATGGEKYHTLTVNEIPSHTHTGSGTTSTDGAHYHRICASSANSGARAIGDSTANGILGAAGTSWSYETAPGGMPLTHLTEDSGSHSHTFSFTTNPTGGGQPHENRPPYYALAFIMKL
jgi:microcystin-dependent protein